MADRFPLIANSSANQIQEIASGDRLDLTGTDVVNLKAVGVLTAATGNITGNMTVGGVLTYDDVTNVDSLGIITARGGLKVVGGGATITGVTTFFNDIRVKGVIENVSAATTFLDANSKVVLELDLLGSTTYSYAMQPASIGIVSFKNMPADAQGGATVTSPQSLTIGVRVGTAVTFSLTGSTFNIPNRAGGNTAINV